MTLALYVASSQRDRILLLKVEVKKDFRPSRRGTCKDWNGKVILQYDIDFRMKKVHISRRAIAGKHIQLCSSVSHKHRHLHTQNIQQHLNGHRSSKSQTLKHVFLLVSIALPWTSRSAAMIVSRRYDPAT